VPLFAAEERLWAKAKKKNGGGGKRFALGGQTPFGKVGGEGGGREGGREGGRRRERECWS